MREWLKELRQNQNLTQEQMADKLEIPKTTYASYEQGKRTPKVSDAKTLADKLSIDWTIFFENDVLESSTNLGQEVS